MWWNLNSVQYLCVALSRFLSNLRVYCHIGVCGMLIDAYYGIAWGQTNFRDRAERNTEAFVVRNLSIVRLLVLYVQKLPNYLNVLSSAG